MGLLNRLRPRRRAPADEEPLVLRTPVETGGETGGETEGETGGETPFEGPSPPLSKPRRRRRVPGWLWRGTAAALGVGLLAAYLGGVYYLSREGWIDARLAEARAAVERGTAAEGMYVRSIRLAGAERTEPAAVRAVLQPAVGMPILAVELEPLRRKVEALPWVRAASLERAMPDRLVVRLSERQPLALWQRGQRIALVDDFGAPVPGVPLQPFADLPLLAGKGADKAAPAFVRLLARTPALAARVTGAARIRQRRWDVRFDDRLWVKLPADDAEATWLRFAKEQRDHDLLSRNVLAIDLRNPRQWVLRLPPGERLRMSIQNSGT